MSKMISALHRAIPDAAEGERRMRRILEEITPDIAGDQARYGFEARGRHLRGTLNMPSSTLRAGMSLCQGKIYGAAEGWAKPGAAFPDGSYALIRENAGFLEAVSDPTASRTLWYYFDDEVFVVSNSQRMITLYVGRFAFDPAVVPWILATGALGFGMSYSRHLRILPPASGALLDKAAWSLRLTEGEIRFAADPRPPEAHRGALRAALDDTLAAFGPEDARRAIISLSGGADSRAIAALLARAGPARRWRSLSGGPEEAQRTPNTDAFVAAQVAARLGLDHRYIATHDSNEPSETIINRFILASEGRVDHLEGYLDGLVNFRALAAEGIEVMIRGDTCFGGPRWAPAESDLAMRRTISLLLCGEIVNLQPRLAAFGLEGQAIPEALARRDGESLLAWRDRVYLLFRATTVLSALTETKAVLIDVVNPLLSRRSLEVACALPDAMRFDKALFREVIRDFVPDLPFAQHHGGRTMIDVLRRPAARRLLAASLDTATARDAFGDRLVDWIRGEIDPVRQARARAYRAVARLAGHRAAAPGAGPAVHPLRLAFRVHMARVMIDRLGADAALLGAAREPEQRRRA